jgi:Tol biopolymer transport system component
VGIAITVSRYGINNNNNIYVIDADGSGARNLTPNAVDDWSPDGKRIACDLGVRGTLPDWHR